VVNVIENFELRPGKMFLHRPPIRQFGFKTYYYNPDKEIEEDEHRVKFKRILRSPKPARKPVRRWLILLIGLLFFIWYFQNTRKPSTIHIENVIIEDVSPK
jgi:hypothetical protein